MQILLSHSGIETLVWTLMKRVVCYLFFAICNHFYKRQKFVCGVLCIVTPLNGSLRTFINITSQLRTDQIIVNKLLRIIDPITLLTDPRIKPSHFPGSGSRAFVTKKTTAFKVCLRRPGFCSRCSKRLVEKF